MIPSKIKISGYDYEVIVMEFNDKSCPAYTNFKKQKIFINEEYQMQTQEASLLHEILEVINYIFEFDFSHDKIQILESALYQVLKDNFKITTKEK